MEFSDFAMNDGERHEQVIPITIFVAVLCFCLLIGHLLGESRWVNESITALIIGCLTGTIILLISKWKSSHILRFDEELFFIYLLPPIIFNAGFQVKKKQFFHNFFAIMLFGVVGVFISSSIITAGSWFLFPKFGFTGLNARDYLGIGTIFSSTDTVCTLQVLHQEATPFLYSLVFGEGVVNDATSVVLFNAVQKIDVNRIDGWTAVHTFVDFLYLFSTSTALGVAAGLLTACILKGLYFGRHSTVREIALMVLMAYLSYMLAEVQIFLTDFIQETQTTVVQGLTAVKNSFWQQQITGRELSSCIKSVQNVGCFFIIFKRYRVSFLESTLFLEKLFDLSGILTVFFSGILMSHYAWHNVTESSRITTRHVFATMSFIAETFIFLYVGMDALDIEKWKMSKLSFGNSIRVYGSVMLLVMLGRAAFVFPLSVLSNCMSRTATRSSSITFKHQIIIWWAGLMRGAVSIALAFKQFTHYGVSPDQVDATMVTTTIIVVLFSTIVFGFLTKPLVNYLLPHSETSNIDREPSISKEDMKLPLLSFQESAETNLHRVTDSLSMLMERPVYTIHSFWRRFDDAYMRPMFGGPRSSLSS